MKISLSKVHIPQGVFFFLGAFLAALSTVQGLAQYSNLFLMLATACGGGFGVAASFTRPVSGPVPPSEEVTKSGSGRRPPTLPLGLILFVFCIIGLSAILATVSCTPAEQQVALGDIDTALSASQKVCTDEELAAAVVPPGTILSEVTGDLSLGCNIDLKYAPGLEAKIGAKLAALQEAGLSADAGATYVPGPRTLEKLRARAAIVLDASPPSNAGPSPVDAGSGQ